MEFNELAAKFDEMTAKWKEMTNNVVDALRTAYPELNPTLEGGGAAAEYIGLEHNGQKFGFAHDHKMWFGCIFNGQDGSDGDSVSLILLASEAPETCARVIAKAVKEFKS